MNTIIQFKCANCGKEIECRMDRLPVCDCGFTRAIQPDDIYAKCFFRNGGVDKVVLIKRNLLIKILSTPEDMIKNLIDVPIEDDRRVYTKCYIDLVYHRDQVENYTANEIVLHSLYFDNSEVYKYLFKKEFYSICRAMINVGREFLGFESNTEKERLDVLGAYITEQMNYQQLYTGLICCLKGIEVRHSYLIQDLELDQTYLPMLKRFEIEYDVTVDKMYKDLAEILKMERRGIEALRIFEDYHRMRQDMQLLFDMDFDNIDGFENRYSMIKRMYNENLHNGHLGTEFYKLVFEEDYQSIMYNGLIIKRVGSKEIDLINEQYLRVPQVLDEPIVAVCDTNGIPITLVTNEAGKIKINGINNDTIKSAINFYLDQIGYGD